jgi:hypothetical protein
VKGVVEGEKRFQVDSHWSGPSAGRPDESVKKIAKNFAKNRPKSPKNRPKSPKMSHNVFFVDIHA